MPEKQVFNALTCIFFPIDATPLQMQRSTLGRSRGHMLLSSAGTLLQQQGLPGVLHAGGRSVEHSKVCDCSGHQISARMGHFLTCSPGSSQWLSNVGLALL